jgi:hypothetical protein
MKKAMLLLLLISSVFANAQTLKEALYGGKLKNKAGTVIRKGDDLAAQMDTASNTATNDTGTTRSVAVTADTSEKTVAIQADSVVVVTTEIKDTTAGSSDTLTAGTTSTPDAVSAPKSNNALLKTYMDSIATALKTEALASKKVKRGSYYVLVSYTIEIDGQVSFSDVFISPENAYLQQQIKDRLAVDALHLSPVLNSTGAPRKVTKKYNFTLSKE